jgi:hypothetical protein
MPMQVFISWSGETSRQIALALRDWLPQAIQVVEPWMSEKDIPKGTRWLDEIGKQLERGQVGIICLTPDNLPAPWVHFEAGALAKGLQQSRILTYLFDLTHSQVEYPLAQFNHTLANEADTLKLLKSINEALPGKRLIEEAVITRSFEKFWPDLRDKLDTIRKQRATTTTAAPPTRTQEDLTQEVLELVRSLLQRQSQLEAWVQTILSAILRLQQPGMSFSGGNALLNALLGSQPSIQGTGGAVIGGNADISDVQRGPDGPMPAGQRFRSTPTDTR